MRPRIMMVLHECVGMSARTLCKFLQLLHRPSNTTSDLCCTARKLAALGWLSICFSLLLVVEQPLPLRAELRVVSLFLCERDTLLEFVRTILYG